MRILFLADILYIITEHTYRTYSKQFKVPQS